ncbi:MAG: hypothetical protein L6433_04695 [Actinomycetia bacterium]|nr:hypothetical protein [Actinomycetota bacterium]MCG2818286.1 hypothetical protein [Actinomycetes bacterium]
MGDEEYILGFKPRNNLIIRLPSIRDKIAREHPEVDQDRMGYVYSDYNFQSISKKDPACLERFAELKNWWHIVVVKFREDWNKLLTFHRVRLLDLRKRTKSGRLLDRNLNKLSERGLSHFLDHNPSSRASQPGRWLESTWAHRSPPNIGRT